MYPTCKVLLQNREDFNKFLSSLTTKYYTETKKVPNSYPCVVVQWDGEDCSYYEDFEFVYLSDLYPMLQ